MNEQLTPGTRVVHRRYVAYGEAHYKGNLVDGAYSLALFGDVATEMCMLTDGDEGLFASYSDVQFKMPVRGGDLLEVVAELVEVGRRSRTLSFTATVVGRSLEGGSDSSATILSEPIVATTARGVVVVP